MTLEKGWLKRQTDKIVLDGEYNMSNATKLMHAIDDYVDARILSALANTLSSNAQRISTCAEAKVQKRTELLIILEGIEEDNANKG